MITRPSFAAAAASLAALSFMAGLGMTPHVSHDRPPGEPVRFWWSRISPLGYALHTLKVAPGVFVADARFVCPDPESSLQAWRTVAAHAHADSVFRHLFAATHGAGRLYALLGLTHMRSSALPQTLAIARRDSTEVRILAWTGQPGDTAPPRLGLDAVLPLSALVRPRSLTLWASLLSQPSAIECAA